MDKAKQINGYFNQVIYDTRLKGVDICVYVALCYSWMINGFKNPFNISRRKIMKIAKVKSKTTYHKSINDLKRTGHIQYHPSYHPTNGTSVTLLCKQSSIDDTNPEIKPEHEIRTESDGSKISAIQS